jgi:hypothetical protein
MSPNIRPKVHRVVPGHVLHLELLAVRISHPGGRRREEDRVRRQRAEGAGGKLLRRGCAGRWVGCLAGSRSHEPRAALTHKSDASNTLHTIHTHPSALAHAHHPPSFSGREQSYHWGYYSCNGFSPDITPAEREGKWKGLEPLWVDVLSRHKALPMHVLVRVLFGSHACVWCVCAVL